MILLKDKFKYWIKLCLRENVCVCVFAPVVPIEEMNKKRKSQCQRLPLWIFTNLNCPYK